MLLLFERNRIQRDEEEGEMSSRFGPGFGRAKVILTGLALAMVFYGVCLAAGPVEVMSGKGKKISLDVGRIHNHQAQVPITRVSSANDAVATVTGLSPNQVYATGKGPGVTTITLWQSEDKVAAVYDVEVAPDVSRLREKLHSLFPEEKGLKISASYDSITLAGTVTGAAVLAQAVALAEAYAGEKKVVNSVQVSGVQQVMLEVRVAEMQKTLTKNLTINFHVAALGTNFGTSMLGSLVSLPSLTIPSSSLNFNVAPNTNALFHIGGGSVSWTQFIDALKEDGLVKILAEPTLMTLSGQQATFLAGGQFPVPIPQGLGTVGIEYKDYGVSLKFTPVVLEENKISMLVAPEVSELDFTTAITIQGTTVRG